MSQMNSKEFVYNTAYSVQLLYIAGRVPLNDIPQIPYILWFTHPELTRERSILFLLFEIKRVFVNNSTVFRLTDLFSLYFFIQNVNANKKVFKIKGYTIM